MLPKHVTTLQLENDQLKASLEAQSAHSASLKRSLELRQFGGKPFPTTQQQARVRRGRNSTRKLSPRPAQVMREVVRLRKESHTSSARLLALEHQNKMLSGAFKVRRLGRGACCTRAALSTKTRPAWRSCRRNATSSPYAKRKLKKRVCC